ncbi:hypothetical protein [Streptomyces sp. NBC_00557]|uniref:hypothetical protein n=1 Tax=Streptomyces sp. NBC_00557 TaxID=2975776 RepID=UPI002E81FBB7|nr:hypothetical protein [Streptomyces sp. NBC_00557]WUC35768.1 hypothetical protein OG956_16825 [Streptomyces sp. NBC_00557]
MAERRPNHGLTHPLVVAQQHVGALGVVRHGRVGAVALPVPAVPGHGPQQLLVQRCLGPVQQQRRPADPEQPARRARVRRLAVLAQRPEERCL